jgi:hypothetical protein
MQCRGERFIDVDPDVGRAFIALARRVPAIGQGRADEANGLKRKVYG